MNIGFLHLAAARFERSNDWKWPNPADHVAIKLTGAGVGPFSRRSWCNDADVFDDDAALRGVDCFIGALRLSVDIVWTARQYAMEPDHAFEI